MTLACNELHNHFGIDPTDPDPEADFTCVQIECGKAAIYGDRLHADPNCSGTILCGACYDARTPDERVDLNVLNAEHLPP